MTGAELLKMDEAAFSTTIQEMPIKDLMETISGLQKEMAKEQENFNSLSSEMKNFKDRNSRQYKQISKDMVASQQRLTLLMNRSIKCFAQQNLHNNTDSPLKRRNSAKGLSYTATPASASTNLHRSKSLLAVNQTDGAHLPSSFQSPTKPHVAESRTNFQYSINVAHVPVIMTTAKNGTVQRSLQTGVNNNNTNDRIRQAAASTNAVSSCEVKVLQPPTASTVAGNQSVAEPGGSFNGGDSTDGGGHSNSVSASSGVSGGMYVKRKPAQQARVTTTANISSSKFMTTSQPVSLPVSESATSTPSSLTSLTTRAPSSHLAGSASVSSSANESQFVKSKPVVSQSEYVSPLQMAQARKGVSKSQTLIQDADSSYQGFRGLPSVKLLAQTFGSNTALNMIPGPSTNFSSSHTNKVTSTSTGVYRSNSSLNLSNPQSSAAPTRIFISKGSPGGASEQAMQQEPALYVNGKSQQHSKQFSRLPQTSTSNSSNEPTELEKTRSKLRAVKRETTFAETAGGSVNSAVIAPTRSPAAVVSVKEQERIAESPQVDKYVRRKDISSKVPTSVQSASSVTIKSINSSSSLASSRITNTVPPPSSQNRSVSQPSSVHVSSPNVKTNNFNSLSKHHATSSNSPLTKQPTTPQSRPVQQKQQSRTTNNTKMTYATLPHREPASNERVVSAATVTIRRAKSREELQQIESDTRSNKDLLLQQIQARRRDAETHGGGSNMRVMSSLSQSMPSLLHDGKYACFVPPSLCPVAREIMKQPGN